MQRYIIENSILINKERIGLKKNIKGILIVCFRIYTDNGIMDYELFMKFCRDFDIFPELCSKSLVSSRF